VTNVSRSFPGTERALERRVAENTNRILTVPDRAPAPATQEALAGLECRIGRAHIAVPVDAVARILEYQPVTLPLAKKWVGGLAIVDGAPLLSVALVPPAPMRTRVSGILLNQPDSQLAWAVEVDEIFVFVRARLQPRRGGESAKVPRWISSALTSDGRQIGWIDVPLMLADLAQVAEETR
jgi:chemotaxis signal transduction protein